MIKLWSEIHKYFQLRLSLTALCFVWFQIDKELETGEYFLKDEERKARKQAQKRVNISTYILLPAEKHCSYCNLPDMLYTIYICAHSYKKEHILSSVVDVIIFCFSYQAQNWHFDKIWILTFGSKSKYSVSLDAIGFQSK